MNMPVTSTAVPEQVDLEQVKAALPKHLQGMVTQSLVDKLNHIAADPVFAEQVRNNFISYTHVMKDGKFKLDAYLSAVTYVSYKLMGNSNTEAYAKTFPDRYQRFLAEGRLAKDIAAYVAAYSKGKLVNLIYEQSTVPLWVLNQHVVQQAINTQVELMTTSQSDKVRQEAANSILTHLKRPDVKEFQINMDVQDHSGIAELREAMKEMSQKQDKLLESGESLQELAGSPLIEAKVIHDSDPD